jgi:hypothetical protein
MDKFFKNKFDSLVKVYEEMCYSLQGTFNSQLEYESNRKRVMEKYKDSLFSIFSEFYLHYSLLKKKKIDDYNIGRETRGYGFYVTSPKYSINLIIPQGNEMDQNGAFMTIRTKTKSLSDIFVELTPKGHVCYGNDKNLLYFFINKRGFNGNKMVKGYDGLTNKYAYTYCPNKVGKDVNTNRLETTIWFND